MEVCGSEDLSAPRERRQDWPGQGLTIKQASPTLSLRVSSLRRCFQTLPLAPLENQPSPSATEPVTPQEQDCLLACTQ